MIEIWFYLLSISLQFASWALRVGLSWVFGAWFRQLSLVWHWLMRDNWPESCKTPLDGPPKRNHASPPFNGCKLLFRYAHIVYLFICNLKKNRVKFLNTIDWVCAHFKTLESEGPAVVQERRPPKDWPQRGSILFSNVKMRYRPNLPLVLNDVSFHIRPKEKIGNIFRVQKS